MANTIPTVPSYTGDIALRTDPENFPANAEAQYTYQALLSEDLNVTVESMNVTGAEVESNANAAESSASASANSAAQAQDAASTVVSIVLEDDYLTVNHTFDLRGEVVNELATGYLWKPRGTVTLPYTTDIATYPLASQDPNLAQISAINELETVAISAGTDRGNVSYDGAGEDVVGYIYSPDQSIIYSVPSGAQGKTINSVVDAVLTTNDLATYKLTPSKELQYSTIQELKLVSSKDGTKLTTLGYNSAGDLGAGNYLNRGNGWPVTADEYVNHSDSAGNFIELQVESFIKPEQAGCIGVDRIADATFVNTTNMQALLNVCSRNGQEIKLSAGKKYLTGRMYLYQDAANTVAGGYAGRTGRVKITGNATGLFTGDDEPQGCALVHIDGEATPFFDMLGNFTFATAGQSGGYIKVSGVNIVGGSLTTDVIRLEGSQGFMSFSEMTVRVYNKTGNGVSERTTWETTWTNILIRGDGDRDNPQGWTGTGLDITSSLDTDVADGQNNMKVYKNVNVYNMGTNIEIGRKAQTKGTFAPLVFIGGQASRAENHNLVIGGGAYANLFLGWQSEGAYKNGVLVDRDTPVTANDLPRSNKFISCYFTNNGYITDGTSDEFQVCILDTDGVEFDTPVLQNSNSGFYIDPSAGALNTLIRRPLFRTVTTYGQASGTGIKLASGALSRIKLEDPTFNQNFSKNIDDPSSSIGRSMAGGIVSISGNSATPSITLANGDIGGIVNFNNSLSTTVTDIIGSSATFEDLMQFKKIICTFDNTITTISDNANIFLDGGVDFTPNSSRASLTLMYKDGAWQEVGRSNG